MWFSLETLDIFSKINRNLKLMSSRRLRKMLPKFSPGHVTRANQSSLQLLRAWRCQDTLFCQIILPKCPIELEWKLFVPVAVFLAVLKIHVKFDNSIQNCHFQLKNVSLSHFQSKNDEFEFKKSIFELFWLKNDHLGFNNGMFEPF